MEKSVRDSVHRRANARCEYCHLPQAGHEERFSIDHVIARQHLDDDSADNLALCCLRCNLFKGTNLSGLDPTDQSVVNLYHPRQQDWRQHFVWHQAILVGQTPVGRATIATLRMNSLDRVRLRQTLLKEGLLRLD